MSTPLTDLTGTASFGYTERRLGLIVPYDFCADDEYWRWIGNGQTLCIARTPHYDYPVGVEMANAIQNTVDLAVAAKSLAVVSPAATLYACTSASFISGIVGEQDIKNVMAESGLEQPLTTSGALLDALASLNVRRIAIGSPYDIELTQLLAHFLNEAGYEVVNGAFFGLDGNISQLDAKSVYRLAQEADCPEADAVFLSCTNLRTYEVIPRLERDLGKPVISSNQVSAWALMRAAGTPWSYGSLWTPTRSMSTVVY